MDHGSSDNLIETKTVTDVVSSNEEQVRQAVGCVVNIVESRLFASSATGDDVPHCRDRCYDSTTQQFGGGLWLNRDLGKLLSLPNCQ